MKLPENMSPEELLVASLESIKGSYRPLSASIDNMTSSELKRVLKTITFLAIGQKLEEGTEMKLREAEQQLIDDVLRYQEDVMGYLTLKNEIDGKNKDEETTV